ncbi:MAG: hypothetical protein IT371_26035 [Deltaproteobacteria bacterium]|nr:hypothetical protein [Deltaproteobacteria bacterium]
MFIHRRALAIALLLLASAPSSLLAAAKPATASRRAADALVLHHQKFRGAKRTDMVVFKQPDGGYQVRYEVSSHHTYVFHYDAQLRPTKAEARTWDKKGLAAGKATVRPIPAGVGKALDPIRSAAQNLCRSAHQRNADILHVATFVNKGVVHVNEWIPGTSRSTARTFELASGKRLTTNSVQPSTGNVRQWDQGGKQSLIPAEKRAPQPNVAPGPKGGNVRPATSTKPPPATGKADPLAAAALQIVEGGLRLPGGYRVARVKTPTGKQLMLGKVAKLGNHASAQQLVKVGGKTYLVSAKQDGSGHEVSGRMGAIGQRNGKVVYGFQAVQNGQRVGPIHVHSARAEAFPKGFMSQPRVVQPHRQGGPVRVR